MGMRGQPLCCPRFFCFVHYVLRVHSAIGTAISFTQSSCFGGVNEVVCFSAFRCESVGDESVWLNKGNLLKR